MKKIDRLVKIWGMPFFSSDRVELLNLLTSHLKSDSGLTTIYTPNPEQVVLSRENGGFGEILRQGDILLPDGVGLIWASRLLSLKTGQPPLAERIAGVEVVSMLWAEAPTQGWRVLVVGGRQYQQLGEQWLPGYENVQQPTTAEEAEVVLVIEETQPDIVFVAFGAPWQEQWIHTHRPLLEKAGVSLAMAVGGSFDFLLGKVKRAPVWMQKFGLEWLYRLLQQPWRWKRQLRLLKFIGLTLQEWARA